MTPQTETFTAPDGTPAVRYLTDDSGTGIAAGSELLVIACTTPCDGTGWTGNPYERCTTHYLHN